MQEHIKGPYSENYKNIKPIPHKKRNLKKQLLHIFSGYSHFIYWLNIAIAWKKVFFKFVPACLTNNLQKLLSLQSL